MRSEGIHKASQTDLSESDWNDLVTSLNGNLDLALAARIFYISNRHSTHSFDYYVPDHFEYDNVPPQVAEYLDRARIFVQTLKNTFPDPDRDEENFWFIAAQLVGVLNRRDNISLKR